MGMRRNHLPPAALLIPALMCGWLAAAPQSQSGYAAAARQVREGRQDAAIPILEEILSANPGDLKARNLLGIALLNAGRQADASAQFRKALQTDPKFQPALKNLAVNEMALGQQREAQSHFEQLLKLAPADPVAHLYMGEVFFAQGHYTQAAAHYQQSGGLQLKDPKVVVHFARCAVESRHAALAEQALENLPAPSQAGQPASSDTAQLQFDAGLLLAGARRFEAAARHFELARTGYPDTYQVAFNLTLVYLNGGNYAAAISSGEPLARGSGKAESYNLLARAYEAAGRTLEAYEALRTAARINPEDEVNYLDLMSLCLTHENWDLSLEVSDIALSRIPRGYRIRLQRGAVLAMKGRLGDAETEFLAAAKLAPEVSLPWVALALVRIEMKQPDEAVQVLRARRVRDPKDYRVNWVLAEALNQSGPENDREAVAALEDAVSAKPPVPGPHVLLGKMLAKRGESGRAAIELEEALKLDPNELTAAYQLALIYRKAGNVKRAQELMTKVGQATSAPAAPAARSDLVTIIRESSK